MPSDPPLVESQDEMQPELYKEADATQEPTDPKRHSWLPHLDWYVCKHAGIRVISCLSARFFMQHAYLERKREAVQP